MKKYLKLPPGVNPNKNNIFPVNLPYYLLTHSAHLADDKEQKWVVFWGVPFRQLPTIYADEKEFIRQANLCLDYVRRGCVGCKLFYKTHPNETDEQTSLDLTGFQILSQKEVAEFFIDKFSASPKTNKLNIPQQPDAVLRENLLVLLKDRPAQTIWFILGDPGSLTSVILLARFIKELAPQAAIGLIIERHHRWQVMNLAEVKTFFDHMLVYPRWLPSLRPNKIWAQLKTAWALRRAPIAPNDIIFGFNYTAFVENCLLTYFPSNLKVAFVKKETLEFCYGSKEKAFFQNYFSRIGHRFYARVIQPILGLYPTVFLEDPVRVANFDRYLMPINDLYDQVYVY